MSIGKMAELEALLLRKAKAGVERAAYEHAESWKDELAHPGPSEEGQFPSSEEGRTTLKALRSIKATSAKGLSAASGSDASVEYLTHLESDLFSRKGCADAFREHKDLIRDAARAAMESQR